MNRQAFTFTQISLAFAGLALAAGLFYQLNKLHGAGTPSIVGSARDVKNAAVNFIPGEEQTFSVHMNSAVAVQGQLNPKQGAPMTVELSGTLHLLTLSVSGSSQHSVLVRISEPSLSFVQGSKISSAADMPFTSRGLIGGMVIDYASDGAIAAFRQEADLDRFASQLLRQAASGIQFSLILDTGSGWTRREIDGTGSYKATYHQVADAHDAAGKTRVLVVDKDKSGYGTTFAAATNTAMQVSGKVTGHFTGRIDPSSGWPQDVTGTERLSVTVGQAMTSTAATTYNYHFLGREQLTADAVDKLRKNITHLASGVTPAEHHATLLKSYAAERLGATTLSELRQQGDKLADLERSQRSTAQRAVFDKTVAYVRLHADDLRELQAGLAGYKPNDPWLLNSLNALAHVGCASCQALLQQEVMSRSSEPGFATSLVVMLSEPLVPSVAAEQALRTLATSSDPDTKMVAQLSLGTVANKLAAADSGRSAAIVTDYLSQFNQAATPADKMNSLSVLGNSGSPLIIPAVGTLLDDPSEYVRVAAVQALRNVPSPDAATALSKMLVDSSSQVRLAVVQSFAQQPTNPATGEALAMRLASESSSLIRGAIVGQLATYYQSVPLARAAIDRMANSDPDVNLRVMAKNTATMNGAH